jgi:hypothetical protein
MCANEYDHAYGFYGGSWQREALCEGRVGSAFRPAGGPVAALPPEETILAPARPVPTENPAEDQELPPPRPPAAGDAPPPEASRQPSSNRSSARRKAAATPAANRQR